MAVDGHSDAKAVTDAAGTSYQAASSLLDKDVKAIQTSTTLSDAEKKQYVDNRTGDLFKNGTFSQLALEWAKENFKNLKQDNEAGVTQLDFGNYAQQQDHGASSELYAIYLGQNFKQFSKTDTLTQDDITSDQKDLESKGSKIPKDVPPEMQPKDVALALAKNGDQLFDILDTAKHDDQAQNGYISKGDVDSLYNRINNNPEYKGLFDADQIAAVKFLHDNWDKQKDLTVSAKGEDQI
ncbi:MAG: hypothetical protein ACRD3W_16810, partial [Terriglobales bacterium]